MIRRTRRQHGSALLLVVVLVLLLAMMGTAFLVAARLSREQITGTGGTPAIAANEWWPPLPAGKLNTALTVSAESQVTTDLGNALTGGVPGQYRQPAAGTPDIVGTGLTANLQLYASRAPYSVPVVAPTPAEIHWPFLSQFPTFPLVDPRDATAVPRNDARITSLTISYPPAYAPIAALAGRTRVFPAFLNPITGLPQLAADADGDGVADAGLMDMLLPTDTVLCQDGISHTVKYYAAIRIVDNAGAVNFNTAWSSLNDYDFAISGANLEPDLVPLADPRRALLGTFRSHIGLRELIFGDYSATHVPTPDVMAGTDLHALNQLRMNPPTGTEPLGSNVMIGDDVANTPQPAPYLYRSQGDALENSLARRLANPAKNAYAGSVIRPYQSYTSTIAPQALTHRFGLTDNDANDFTTRFVTAKSAVNVVADPRKNFRYYGANQYDFWFYSAMEQRDYARNLSFYGWANSSLANYPGTFPTDPDMIRSYRPYVVTSNPISNRVSFHSTAFTGLGTLGIVGAGANQMAAPYSPSAGIFEAPPRTSANTATFNDLWRAFWEVMVSDPGVGTPPPAADLNIFRTPLRYVSTVANLDTGYTALIRSAAAAANTVALRDPAVTTPVQPIAGIAATLDVGGVPTATPVNATVYGLKRQLFVTEVYANNDDNTTLAGLANPNGYIAIELYNPYPATDPPMDLTNIYVGSVIRNSAAHTITAGSLPLRQLSTLVGANSLAGQGRIVLDNYAPGTDANWRPAVVTLTGTASYYLNLQLVAGQEFVVLRAVNPAAPPADPTDAGFVPLDTFDFAGFTIPTAGTAPVTHESWHYVRRNGLAADQWRCVYPGQYKPALATRRNEGTVYQTWTIASLPQTSELETTTWLVDALGGWRAAAAASTQAPVALGAADTNQTYAYSYQIPLNLTNWPGPNVAGQFPFGLFARDGDLLQVPFIGAYRIMNGASVVELTPVTMDAAFADDTNDANNADEQLGRFISIAASTGVVTLGDPYAWTSKLTSYLTTIQNPSDDYMPNVPPSLYAGATPVANRPGVANGFVEDSVPIQGKINIETAPWQVLAALPMIRAGDDPRSSGVPLTQDQAAFENRCLAKAIVRFRDVDGSPAAGIQPPHGAFNSIAELNLVPGYVLADLGEDPADPNITLPGSPSVAFRNAFGPTATSTPGFAQGDLSPDTLLDTFRNRTLAITRISNLITTRSDSFTAYILVQAWMDAGTPLPVCVGEQREVLVIDRSGMSVAVSTIPAAGIQRFPVQP